ncbi:MAG: AbrB/MazE/SpoVT family DNA-binding domain-containing protein [Desulfobulbaceae bacterium]|nr:AbrB/MazE/SpoVT family DNA-binding domain-containing protein [Desulfobulbaceae bacterium]
MQTTISSKYQVVIPKSAREHLNLKPKQKLTVIEKDKMLILPSSRGQIFILDAIKQPSLCQG